MRKTINIRIITSIICLLITNSIFAQFAGGTYTIGTGGGENYSSLLSACAALNTAGTLAGDVIFEITTDLTEAVNIPLGVNTSGFSITFRPSADVNRTISFTQTAANGFEIGNAPLGCFVIGTTALANYNSLVATSNVIISGLPSGGSVSRLTFKKSGGSNDDKNYPISVVGNSENITLNDLTIEFIDGNFNFVDHFAIALITYKDGTGNQYAPDYFTVDNCTINATHYYKTWGFGALLGGSNGYTYSGDFPDNLIIKNSNFNCGGGAIYLSDFANVEIFNNTFNITSSSLSANNYGIKVEARLDYADVNINSNNFNSFSSLGNTLKNERVIDIMGNYKWLDGTAIIYNNTISGIAKPISSGSGNQLYLIDVASAVANITYNTLYLTNLSSNTQMAAFYPYRGISLSNSTKFTLKNNIIYIEEDDFQTVGIYFEEISPDPDFDVSDYNNIYRVGTTNAQTGYADGIACATLADWQAATALFGVNSVSKLVNFTSSTDLHLAGASIGDAELIGTSVDGITTDIDGDIRHETFPYMGADENTASPLPVELTSFTATSINSATDVPIIVLNWTTATEVSNYGFEVERNLVNEDSAASGWEIIGFVQGSGNSNSPKRYEFIDEQPPTGNLQYRLKQIDTDGSYTYYTTIAEISNGITDVKSKIFPTEYSLSQNYPNPFNPSTEISYQLPAVSQVTLKVYDILGREVATLVNKEQNAGNYNVKFDASKLTSGIYFYTMESGNFVQTKKLLLMK